jgi:hypothetical protein
MKVIRALAFANGVACPIAGQYLVSMDFEAFNGRGFARYSSQIEDAKKFASPAEALEFWRTTSKINPKRPDGRPNRPLTSTTIEIIEKETA